jgi:hypothetical protein
MRYLMVMIIALLVPAAAMAKGECKADKEKFCKDVVAAKGKIGPCLKKHTAELSEACKTRLEAGKQKSTEGSAKIGKEEGTHTEPGHGTPPESDTKKIDQPRVRTPQPAKRRQNNEPVAVVEL